MDETPVEPPLGARRRRLLFRATHRGTKEADILIGGFVTRHIAAFTDADIESLESLLELPDPVLADWLTGRVQVPADMDNAMLQWMRGH
jgi:antitoxin CptB